LNLILAILLCFKTIKQKYKEKICLLKPILTSKLHVLYNISLINNNHFGEEKTNCFSLINGLTVNVFECPLLTGFFGLIDRACEVWNITKFMIIDYEFRGSDYGL
jgi:hypothetical protein